MRVAGCDLVYPLPAAIATQNTTDEFLFSVIPSNPAYWTGTRIAQMAPAYMNYRPIAMTFHYIPQVAVTQPGSVIFGTLWNGSAPSDDLQQTLNTSNGGGIINCYVPSTTRIALGRNLQQNLFTLNGDINPDTSPFVFVAVARGCTTSGGENQVVPGYFMVDYVYDFKNPIGQSWVYDRSLAVTLPYSDWTLPNRSIILLQQALGYGPGTVFDCEQTSEGSKYYYRGTEVALPEGTLVQAFQNGQTSTVQDLVRQLRKAAGEAIPGEIPEVAMASDTLIYHPKGIEVIDGKKTIITKTSVGYEFMTINEPTNNECWEIAHGGGPDDVATELNLIDINNNTLFDMRDIPINLPEIGVSRPQLTIGDLCFRIPPHDIDSY